MRFETIGLLLVAVVLGCGGESVTPLLLYRPTAADLEALRGRTDFNVLILEESNVTDAGLEHLQGLTGLLGLHLPGAHRVTDAGLEHLKGMSELIELNLRGTQVTDAGLVHLQGMTNLRTLVLMETQVTDAGLDHLKGLTRLKSLNLLKARVSDEGVDKLKEALPGCRIWQ